MICPPCCQAAADGNPKHGPEVCAWPVSCPCQHGTMIECDPDPQSPTNNIYVDMLPEDQRRAAYARIGRVAPDLAASTGFFENIHAAAQLERDKAAAKLEEFESTLDTGLLVREGAEFPIRLKRELEIGQRGFYRHPEPESWHRKLIRRVRGRR